MLDPTPGIHHVTAISGDGQGNVDFYVGVLGLRLVKKTVNFDVPNTYHLYYADGMGTPGTTMTFFVWPHLPPGPQGRGQVTEVSFAVPPGSLTYWADRLAAVGLSTRPQERFGLDVLSFLDPEGLQLQLVASSQDEGWAPWKQGPVPLEHAIRAVHSVTLCLDRPLATQAFLEETMRFRQAGQEGRRLLLETAQSGGGSRVELLEAPEAPRGEEAPATVHHVAWRALDDAHQLAWRARIAAAGLDVTPVIDRKYFHSIYYRVPGGVLFEIATDGPGFTADESAPDLGASLQLPPQYEGTREALKLNLPPLHLPALAEREAS